MRRATDKGRVTGIGEAISQGVSVVVGGWEVELPSVGWLPLGEVLS